MSKRPTPFPEIDPVEILNALPIGVFLTDAGGAINWVNTTLCDQVNLPASELLGRTRTALPAKKTLKLSKSVDWLHVPGKPSTSERRLECVTQKLPDGEGRTVELGCVIDVSRYDSGKRNRLLFPELKDPGKLDPQTGLLNKNVMQQELVGQVSRSRRYLNPLSVVLIRLLLKVEGPDAVAPIQKQRLSNAIAKMLKEKLRWVDIVGCWEKDEFMLILPETALDQAAKLARKLDNYFAKLHKEEERAGRLDVTIRLGMAEWAKGDDVSTLLQRVEASLLKKGMAAADPLSSTRSK